MMFRSAVLASLAASVAAKSFVPNGGIDTKSRAGKKLLQKARGLEQNNQQQGDQDAQWLVGYEIKYLGCSSLVQINREGNEEEGVLYTQNLIKFGLCQQNTCGTSSCSSGDAQYVVNMNDFIDAYTEMQMEEQERNCENVRENCYCENANDDEACENTCYANQGMDYCIEYEGDEEFEIQRYLECDELEGNDGNNNNNNRNYNYNANDSSGINMNWQYYIGPTCGDDGQTINLAVFTDAGCSNKAKSGTYEAFNYGASLPYEKDSIVTVGDCISCIRQDDDQNNNNNNNQNQNQNQNQNYNYNYEVNEICEQSYEMAAKCETNLQTGNNYFYADTSACTYINDILPRLEKATRKISSGRASSSSGSSGTSTAFAVVFFITTCVLAAYSFFLYRKIHRAKVNLAHSEGMTMA